MTGIYCIRNLINQKCYIGQSVDIANRWKQHRIASSYSNLPLYIDIREFGLENFDFSIVCLCNREDLTRLELRTMLDYQNNNYSLYNIIKPENTNIKITDDIILNIIISLQDCELSHSEIALLFDVSVEVVDGINTGRLYRLPNVEYPIVDYKALSEANLRLKQTCPICGASKHKSARYCLSCYLSYKASNIPDRETVKNLVRNNSLLEVGRLYSVSDNAVRRWCDKYNLPRRKSEIKSYSDEDWDKL